MRTPLRLAIALLGAATMVSVTAVWAADEVGTANTPDVGTAKNPNALKAEYKNGFRLYTEDGRFSLRISAGIQYRYSYMEYDHKIKGSENDYSNFFLRRARLYLDGTAFDPRLTYSFHVQLEPTSAVNLHEAYIQYELDPMFKILAGRNKVPYGLEFLNSGFGLNFVDRSIMYGETDVNSGGGFSKWPGGNANFALAAEQTNTGFPTGGLCLYRSQGLEVGGQTDFKAAGSFEYEVGAWNGRDTRGNSNGGSQLMYSARVGYYPLGAVSWQTQGDQGYTQDFRFGFIGSYYAGSSLHGKDASGATVPTYSADDSGHNVAALARFRGFSADLEWGTEAYDLNRQITGRTRFDREAWRASLGYFVVRKRVEVVARYASVERLKDPTADAVINSGLGFVQVLKGSSYVNAIEKRLTESTAGLNVYFGSHQHKLFFDFSLLRREFAPYQGYTPRDQLDRRFRSMIQLKV
jgi:hypothetical protein